MIKWIIETDFSMKRTMNGKTFNTDTSYEMGVTGRMMDVSNGIKTFVIDRMYETREGDEWFLVTTIIKFWTTNEYDYLTSDDVFVSSEKTFQTYTEQGFLSWKDSLSTTQIVTKKN